MNNYCWNKNISNVFLVIIINEFISIIEFRSLNVNYGYFIRKIGFKRLVKLVGFILDKVIMFFYLVVYRKFLFILRIY